MGASENHLAKVMQRLVHAGLVRSVKGPSGGFSLAKSPREISFRETIEAVDGPLTGDFCPFRADGCTPSNCIFGKEISKQAENLVAYLGSRTIADIAHEGAGRIQSERLSAATSSEARSDRQVKAALSSRRGEASRRSV